MHCVRDARWVWHGPCSRSAHNQAEEITRNISFFSYRMRTFLHKWGWSVQYPNRNGSQNLESMELQKKKKKKKCLGFFFTQKRKLMGRIFSTKFFSVFKKLTCTYIFPLVNCSVHVTELFMQVFHGISQVLPEQVWILTCYHTLILNDYLPTNRTNALFLG